MGECPSLDWELVAREGVIHGGFDKYTFSSSYLGSIFRILKNKGFHYKFCDQTDKFDSLKLFITHFFTFLKQTQSFHTKNVFFTFY